MSGGSRVVLAVAIWAVVLAGCGGQQLVKPKAIAFAPAAPCGRVAVWDAKIYS
jgi:hypothetical protein